MTPNRTNPVRPTVVARRQLLTLVCAVLAVSAVRVDAAAPIFADDFSTPALLAEKWALNPPARWKVADGVLAVTAAGSTSATPKLTPITGPIEVRCRVKCLGFDEKGGWCGVGVRGILFTLRPEGFWYVYRIQGQERSLGEMQKTTPPVVGQWYDFKIIQSDKRYTWFVDGKKVADFLEPNDIIGEAGTMHVATAGPGIAYDNVSVASIPADENVSPNAMRNASFEVVPDHVPTYWKPWGVPLVPPEVFWQKWRVDETEAYEGRRSLRVESKKHAGPGFFSHNNNMVVGEPCTFSVYLKANKPGLKAQLAFWEYLGNWAKKPIEVGPEWQRYSFTLDSPQKMSVRAGVRIWDDGVLWADAAQIEAGTEATPFRLSSFETPGPDDASATPVVQPPRHLQAGTVAPVLDGKLDDPVWTDASRVWPLLLPDGDRPGQGTNAYMLLADGVLYIGMRCHDDAIADLAATIREHDGTVYADDCVEIFLDTNHDGMTYYHLAVNALGTRFDAGPGRNMAWNQAWEAKTFVSDTFWSVELALPLSSFNVTPMTATAWGVNLGRENHKAGEYSSTAINPTVNFHCPDRYPVLNWPEGSFVPHMLYPQNWQLVSEESGTMRLTGDVVNRTGREQAAVLAGTCNQVPWTAQAITVADGQSAPFAIEKLAAPASAGGEVRLQGTIKEAGSGRTVREFAILLPVSEVASAVLQPPPPTTVASTRSVVHIDPVRRCLTVDGQPFFVVAPLVGLHGDNL